MSITSAPDDKNAAPDQIVEVSLKERSYPIIIGANLLQRAGQEIAARLKGRRVAIITDEVVSEFHLKTLENSLSEAGVKSLSFILPAGEQTKSFQQYENLLDQLLEAQISRDEALVALGGGVIGDLTGFVAATLKRGIDFIQIPTTLLSQVDSSVGGKTGINSRHGKNLIGAFKQPRLVLADVTTLNTLPKRDVLAGYAEVLKYALLGDFDFFEWLEQNGKSVVDGDLTARIQAVKTSVEAKARIVAEDETEKGVRALLNLGHTFGHALEAETNYSSNLVHGEGVAIGMLMAMELSASMNLLTTQEVERTKSHYALTGLLSRLPAINGVHWNAENLLAHMAQDKKVDQGKLTFILMKKIGDAFITQDVEKSAILNTLERFIQNR
ncbi:3-dehydroquinate synthase [Sneathiella limimaris]|uniref:3-dehydroquinate synthase n=1 Tax=Sneathiella limimaris TaxID=1964213 RepID=UPI00146F86F4|nr:3-dehydroquinate synthase [Sneathiella limimaris]